MQELGNRNIVQIACGDQHAMALSRGSLFQEHFSSKQESCLLWEGSVCTTWGSWWHHCRVMSSGDTKCAGYQCCSFLPAPRDLHLSVSLQFLSTAPPQKCVLESRRGCPTLRSPDVLILKLQHLSGWELLASMTLEVETPGLYWCCAESHGQQGTVPRRSEANRNLATHDGLALELGPWKQHWVLLLFPQCKYSREAVRLSCFLLFCVCRGWALHLGSEHPWTAWSAEPNHAYSQTTAGGKTKGHPTCSNCCWRSSQHHRVTLWSCVLLGKEQFWTAGTRRHER